jgi:hypothetical protein
MAGNAGPSQQPPRENPVAAYISMFDTTHLKSPFLEAAAQTSEWANIIFNDFESRWLAGKADGLLIAHTISALRNLKNVRNDHLLMCAPVFGVENTEGESLAPSCEYIVASCAASFPDCFSTPTAPAVQYGMTYINRLANEARNSGNSNIRRDEHITIIIRGIWQLMHSLDLVYRHPSMKQ